MTFRHEWKHPISPGDLLALRRRLRLVARPDGHGSQGRREPVMRAWSSQTRSRRPPFIQPRSPARRARTSPGSSMPA